MHCQGRDVTEFPVSGLPAIFSGFRKNPKLPGVHKIWNEKKLGCSRRIYVFFLYFFQLSVSCDFCLPISGFRRFFTVNFEFPIFADFFAYRSCLIYRRRFLLNNWFPISRNIFRAEEVREGGRERGNVELSSIDHFITACELLNIYAINIYADAQAAAPRPSVRRRGVRMCHVSSENQ